MSDEQVSDPPSGSDLRLRLEQSLASATRAEAAIEAARRGQGFVIAGPMLLEDEISEKSLVEPFGLCLPVNAGYFVVHPSGSALNPATENLKAWLISEACENGRAALPAGNRNG